MFVHLGGEKMIRTSQIVAIFDISVESSSKLSKQFVTNASQNNQIEKIGEEEAKSLVVTTQKVYYSPISSATLKKRANLLVTT